MLTTPLCSKLYNPDPSDSHFSSRMLKLDTHNSIPALLLFIYNLTPQLE